jgi:endonuclease/exonuclease/phosphatase family metal-dependent hydrolase
LKRINTIVFFSLITILMILSGCSEQAKILAEDIQFKPEQKDCIKVMTFNIRTGQAWWLDGWSQNNWENRKNLVIDTIAENAVDVIGMQEGVASQLEELQDALPQYSKYAVGRDDGENKGETCAIFYRKDRFALEDCGTFWFSEDPEKPGSKNWGNLFPRICSWVRLVDKTNQTIFYVYNVHLDNLSQSSREKSVRLLTLRIASRSTTAPFVLIGDFNMKIDNPAMKYLEQDECRNLNASMSNVWQSVYPGKCKTGTYHKFSGYTACSKIDHISISSSMQAVDVKIDRHEENGHYPSDHFPVIATIRIPTERTFSMKF